MPRRPRLVVPGIPLHVTQRGVNRVATFLDAADRELYLALLDKSMRRHGIAVHSYTLMSNHVHLLVTPAHVSAPARAMSAINQTYVAAFNRKHGRTGTLWEGRFRSCLVDTESYLLTLYRYIELNPVRAAMVDLPAAYRWSSARTNLGLAHDARITPHSAYLDLGRTTAERTRRYSDFLHSDIEEVELRAIREHIRQERALGSERFQRMMARTLNRPVAVRPRGRPRSGLDC